MFSGGRIQPLWPSEFCFIPLRPTPKNWSSNRKMRSNLHGWPWGNPLGFLVGYRFFIAGHTKSAAVQELRTSVPLMVSFKPRTAICSQLNSHHIWRWASFGVSKSTDAWAVQAGFARIYSISSVAKCQFLVAGPYVWSTKFFQRKMLFGVKFAPQEVTTTLVWKLQIDEFDGCFPWGWLSLDCSQQQGLLGFNLCVVLLIRTKLNPWNLGTLNRMAGHHSRLDTWICCDHLPSLSIILTTM